MSQTVHRSRVIYDRHFYHLVEVSVFSLPRAFPTLYLVRTKTSEDRFEPTPGRPHSFGVENPCVPTRDDFRVRRRKESKVFLHRDLSRRLPRKSLFQFLYF